MPESVHQEDTTSINRSRMISASWKEVEEISGEKSSILYKTGGIVDRKEDFKMVIKI